MTKCFKAWIAGSHPLGDAKWIAGSSPAMTRKNKVPSKDKGKRTTIEKRIFINHSEHNAAQEKEKSNAQALAQCQQLFAEARSPLGRKPMKNYNTMLHMKLNSAVSVIAVAAAFAVFLPPSNALAGVCFLPDCQDDGVVQGDINMNINVDTEFCESKGFTYYASGECPQYYAKVGQCNRDDHYLKCDAKTWCEQNGYNTTSCSIPKYVDQPCPSYGSLYKQCKTDNQRACRDTGYTNSCPSGQKLKKNSGRCAYDSSYGTCCRPTGCPSYTSLTYSSYGSNGTDGCEYTCYYTCNMNCPSGTSTSNPGGCGGSTRNGCGTKTCYYPYEACCTPSCTNETGCSCGTTTVSDGCGGTCTRCKSCCNSSSSNWCSVHSTCHGDCCRDGTLKSCDTQCGGSGCSSSSNDTDSGGSTSSCDGPVNTKTVYPCQHFGCSNGGWKFDGQYCVNHDPVCVRCEARFQYSGCYATESECNAARDAEISSEGTVSGSSSGNTYIVL